MRDVLSELPAVMRASDAKPQVWINPEFRASAVKPFGQTLSMADINEAEERLNRFAPFIIKCFPETKAQHGMIESALVPIPGMQACLQETYRNEIPGRLLLKQDSHLAVAGSIKARGGIYEVLKHTEDLALEAGLIKAGDSYEVLATEACREFFSQYTIQVGSTGNLGLSIGIAGASVGYQVIVHMSADARAWKKDLLRSHGVTVLEYQSDYSEAVKNGRRQSDENPQSYFIDDENSENLFLGYAVAAKRLLAQLAAMGTEVDEDHPLFVYLPCGVGGAPGGVAFGLKQLFGSNVHCFFVEPVQAPCMLVGMATGLNQKVCVQDIGLSGQTHADGLAVGRPSRFVGSVMKELLSGIITMEDKPLYDYMRMLLRTEDIFLEPSACAAFEGAVRFQQDEAFKRYVSEQNLTGKLANAVHIAWATGGRLVPVEVRTEYQNTYL